MGKRIVLRLCTSTGGLHCTNRCVSRSVGAGVYDNMSAFDNAECNMLRTLSTMSLPPLVDAPPSTHFAHETSLRLNDRRATSPTDLLNSDRPPPSSFKPLDVSHHLPSIQAKPPGTRCDACMYACSHTHVTNGPFGLLEHSYLSHVPIRLIEPDSSAILVLS